MGLLSGSEGSCLHMPRAPLLCLGRWEHSGGLAQDLHFPRVSDAQRWLSGLEPDLTQGLHHQSATEMTPGHSPMTQPRPPAHLAPQTTPASPLPKG